MAQFVATRAAPWVRLRHMPLSLAPGPPRDVLIAPSMQAATGRTARGRQRIVDVMRHRGDRLQKRERSTRRTQP